MILIFNDVQKGDNKDMISFYSVYAIHERGVRDGE